MLTRFAPSPTGYLHVGNVRTALVCWLYAKSVGGKLILRIDDTDFERSSEEFRINIFKDLNWLGINWDSTFNQATRVDRYNEIFQLLEERGYVYPCYESKEELEIKRKTQLKSGRPPIYDRSALRLCAAEKTQLSQNRKPYYRFKIPDNTIISWHDKIRDDIKFISEHVSDPIVKREDDTYTYMLPSVIDDIDFGITHVVRGEDHINNTAVQIAMFRALMAPVPCFAHLSLLHSEDNKISKRLGGSDIKSMQKDGIEAISINSYLAKLGTSLPIIACTDMQELIDSFDISSFSKAATKFSIEELLSLNSKVVHQMPYEKVKARLIDEKMDSENFWLSVRHNIDKFQEASQWWEICHGNVIPVIQDEDREFLSMAGNVLPPPPWNENTWSQWISSIKKNTNRSSKNIFTPLRLALTGKVSGPELAKILPLISRELVLFRLKFNESD